MQDTKDICLQLSVDEVNLLLQALGNLPFHQVYALIGKIHEQAHEQMPNSNNSKNSIISSDELGRLKN